MRFVVTEKGDMLLVSLFPCLSRLFSFSRYAIETPMGPPSSESEGRRSPFMTLAGYIGVRGAPQNEGGKKIVMTAPVAMKQSDEVREVVLFVMYCRMNKF